MPIAMLSPDCKIMKRNSWSDRAYEILQCEVGVDFDDETYHDVGVIRRMQASNPSMTDPRAMQMKRAPRWSIAPRSAGVEQ
jgi:hypothetical protein